MRLPHQRKNKCETVNTLCKTILFCILLLVIEAISVSFPVYAAELYWNDYRKTFYPDVHILQHGKGKFQSATIMVDLPESFLKGKKTIVLVVKLRSKTKCSKDDLPFSCFRPYFNVNSSFFNHYSIPVKSDKWTQSQELIIKSKDLKIGTNKIRASFAWNSSRGHCTVTGCGYEIKEMNFKANFQRSSTKEKTVHKKYKYSIPVDSNPQGADVFINREKKGTTPLTLELGADLHYIRLEKKGYQSLSSSISLPSMKDRDLIYTLDKQLIMDNTAPVITIFSPETDNGISLVTASEQAIAGKITDFNNIKWVKINNQSIGVNHIGGFYHLVQLSQGDNEFKITASDIYGNTNSKKIIIRRFKKKNPIIVNTIISKGKIYVTTEPYLSKVRILNIKPVFYQGIELKSGKYHIEVSNKGYETYTTWITLGAGEKKSIDVILKQLHAKAEEKEKVEKKKKEKEKEKEKEKITLPELNPQPQPQPVKEEIYQIKEEIVNTDKTAPEIVLSNLITTVSKAKHTIEGNAIDKSGVALVYVNSIQANLDKNGKFFSNILLKFGENIVIVTAFDIYDNKSTESMIITRVENTAPEIIMPDLIKTVSKEKLVIKGKAIDKSGVALVYVNNIEADLDKDGQFSAAILLTPGKNDILVSATDIYNNKATKSFTVTREEISSRKKERKLSLIIGNAAYQHGGELINPVNDANGVSISLGKLDFEIMKYENADQKTMKKAIDTFGRKLKKYDVGLFFYAGHGVQVSGTNYLIPVDARIDNENDVDYDCINVGRVLAKMESAANKTNIIILDACRDNPFERSWNRGVKGSGLAFMNAPAGSLIAYATSPGATAADGLGKNGLYTSVLLEYFQTPKITILEMFQRVRKEVIIRSEGNQTPWESTSLTDNFYLKY